MGDDRAVAPGRPCFLFAAAFVVASCAAVAHGATPLPLAERLVKAGELAGFKPLTPTIVKSAREYAAGLGAGTTTAEQRRLERIGFVAAATEHLAATRLSGRDAISDVVQFRTSAGARAEVAHTVQIFGKDAAVRVQSFRVSGIPGAHGLAVDLPNGKGYDVVFADGPFTYNVGAFTPDKKEPPTAAQVAAAALRLYRRVHGSPAPR